MELNLLFDDIINLEKENLTYADRCFCQEYDEISSRKRLTDEHKDEDLIVYCYRSQILLAFVRFSLKDKKLIVISLQIKKGCEYIFRTLIKDTCSRLENLEFDTVEGDAYKNNILAIALHRKLGLCHSRNSEDKLGFLVSKEQFIISLRGYTKL
ncbi:hypothetical protein [Chamaesiphon sp. VAR_48_metabat_403]|uniref:hypothetical protein n=1 Tax=Chamaesiphon sp. VAR_48_metabat_403 TaxID=2964700 RepID=UPI00286E8B5C|nr:hypothetical protein [Chamaesiphon sp. VAR_48_metabat_403]